MDFIQEEREVLCSIYDSDECFKEQSTTSFTYRVSEPYVIHQLSVSNPCLILFVFLSAEAQ